VSYGYEDNLPPGVTQNMIDEATGYGPESDGLWWDDEAGCWREVEAGFCDVCGLEVTADDGDDLCADCAAEIEAMAHERDRERVRALEQSVRDLLQIAELAEYYAPGELGEFPERTRQIIETAKALVVTPEEGVPS